MGAHYVCVKTHSVIEPPNQYANLQLHAHTYLFGISYLLAIVNFKHSKIAFNRAKWRVSILR